MPHWYSTDSPVAPVVEPEPVDADVLPPLEDDPEAADEADEAVEPLVEEVAVEELEPPVEDEVPLSEVLPDADALLLEVPVSLLAVDALFAADVPLLEDVLVAEEAELLVDGLLLDDDVSVVEEEVPPIEPLPAEDPLLLLAFSDVPPAPAVDTDPLAPIDVPEPVPLELTCSVSFPVHAAASASPAKRTASFAHFAASRGPCMRFPVARATQESGKAHSKSWSR